jgi:hypothetical protein
MKKSLKNSIVILLVAGLFFSITGIATAEEPTFGDITITPEEPTQLSDVKFSVNVTGEDIEEVRLEVEECIGPDFCYAKQNVSMELEDGLWEATVTLEHDDTTVGHSWLVIKSNGTWYNFAPSVSEEYESTDFDILPADDGDDGDDGDGAGDTDDTGGTPGFELILVLISIVVALSIYKRKRIK